MLGKKAVMFHPEKLALLPVSSFESQILFNVWKSHPSSLVQLLEMAILRNPRFGIVTWD